MFEADEEEEERLIKENPAQKRRKTERWKMLEGIIQMADTAWNRWRLLPEPGHMASRYDAFVEPTSSPGNTQREREQACANEE